MLKKILKNIFSQKGVVFLLLLSTFSELVFAINPYIGKHYIDFINSGNMGQEFYFFVLLGCVTITIGVCLSIYREYYKEGFRVEYQKERNIYYFKKYFYLDYENRLNEGTGKTITKVTRGIDAYISLFDELTWSISVFVVRFLLVGGLMFYYFPSLFCLMIIVCLLITFINHLFTKGIKKLTDDEQKMTEDIGRQSTKMIMESNLIKILNKENDELNILEKLFLGLPKLRQKIYFRNKAIYNILDFIFRFIGIICYVILGAIVVRSEMTIGEMTMVIAYITWLWWPIAMIMEGMSGIRNQISKVEALENLVNTPNKIKDGKQKFILKKGEIDFQNINFSYDDKREILNNFSLKIEGGKTIALVGHSGSGKSTLVKLILRNYLVDSGEILIDNQNIKDLKISTFYENIGYLSQEPAVFDGTIKENLAYATNKKLSDEDLFSVLKKVDLYSLISKSDQKLETEIGEKGLKLSGGEKQRLAIARIFLRNPKILILDEPTSSLDSISEDKITKILNSVMKGRTVIVIAHRLQTVMEADKIVVLEEGKIVETGTHSELIKKKGIYSNLVDLQNLLFQNG